jgi:hypothetical protein
MYAQTHTHIHDTRHTALALTFTLKIGVLTDNIFTSLLNERLVEKGTVLEVFTTFLQVMHVLQYRACPCPYSVQMLLFPD